jgi:cyclase
MKAYAERCYSPVTMGGHIDNVDNVRFFFGIGADKVVIGARAACDYTLVGKIAQKYGAQAVTFGLDTDGEHCFMASEGLGLPWKPEIIAKVMEDEGAGEIFLQSRERDGSLSGYDIETLKKVVAAVKIPVIVGTSCGNAGHMKAAFDAGASGCATAVIHQMTENAIAGFKRQLGEYVRP